MCARKGDLQTIAENRTMKDASHPEGRCECFRKGLKWLTWRELWPIAGTAPGALDAPSVYESWPADGVLVFLVLFRHVHRTKPLSQSIPLKCFRNIKLFAHQDGKL